VQGFRRMAARNKPAGIRLLVYGMGKGKGGIEGFERVCEINAHFTISEVRNGRTSTCEALPLNS
jgi:hypothetical protein